MGNSVTVIHPANINMFKALCVFLVLVTISDGIHLRAKRQQSPGGVSLAICGNGNKRSCTCTDGSHANMEMNPCSNGSNMDQKTCECPEGFTKQARTRKSHSLHPICLGTDGDTVRPSCRCSDSSTADWTQHPCGSGSTRLETCPCQEECFS